MPRYKVIENGFFNDVLHKPGHPKHGTVHSDVPLKPIPSWLEAIKDETATERKKRLAAEKKTGETDAAKAAQDKVEVDSMMFTEPNRHADDVETL